MNALKRILSLILVLVLTAGLAGCNPQSAAPSGESEPPQPPQSSQPAPSAPSPAPSSAASEPEPVDNQAAADEVADLIDAIYVQTRTDKTDEQCAAAKAAWDALTDEQKELVEGKFADPDYFGRDTGDASLDDPRNYDGISANELLVVSFGTSYNSSRAADIKGVEDALEAAFPGWSVRRAFTSQIIINHIQARDGVKIDNVEQALERAVANKVENLVIQPTHLMNGSEYDELAAAAESYKDKFKSLVISEPLIGEVDPSDTEVNKDKRNVALAVTGQAVADTSYDSVKAAGNEGVAFVLLGHGTSHSAKVTYTRMQAQMSKLGYKNVFIGTVEGEPEDTACEVLIEKIHDAGYTTVILRPFMVVAGDHANNDMAGEDEDSWISMFNACEYFNSVSAQVAGIGRIPDIQSIYVAHAKKAIDSVK